MRNPTGAVSFEATSNTALEQKQDLIDKMMHGGTDAHGKVSFDQALVRCGYGRFQHRLFVLVGLCWMADAMEVMVLGFLQAEVRREWGLGGVEESLVTSVVFGGELLGCLYWGPLADRRGRRPAFVLATLLISVFGFASAAAPSFALLLLFRFCVGFGIGGLAVPYDLLCEFVPTDSRGRLMMSVQYWWTIGTLLVAGIAWAMLDTLGWRALIAICAVPPTVCLMCASCLPESPRWLLERGRHADAAAVLRGAAVVNGIVPSACCSALGTELTLRDKADADADAEDGVDTKVARAAAHEQGFCAQVRLLLRPGRPRQITLLTWGVWFGFGCTYYGLVLLMPSLFPAPAGQCFNFAEIFTSSAGEIIGLTAVVCTWGGRRALIDVLGRRGVQTWGYGLCGVFMLMVGIAIAAANGDSGNGDVSPAAATVPAAATTAAAAQNASSTTCGGEAGGEALRASLLPHWVLSILALLARGAIMAASCATWVMAPELYETSLRGTGHSAANAVARVGGFITPFIADASGLGVGGVTIVYGVLNFGVAMCSFAYPFDTAGRDMDSEVELKQMPVHVESSRALVTQESVEAVDVL